MNFLQTRKRLSSDSVLQLKPPGELSYTVAITGSTGNVGAYLLDTLLKHPNVGRVICLNRSADAEQKQESCQKTRGLTLPKSRQRVLFIQIALGDPLLGLTKDFYNDLSSSIDILIHNAWPVDFNKHFNSFQESIHGITHVINFALAPTRKNGPDGALFSPIRIIFISSIGVTSNWGSAAPTSRATIPETGLRDWKVARTGYGQSKLVAERLFEHASEISGLPVAIIRVGQLSGPILHGTDGRWNEREWLPSLIKSSIALGALPATLGPSETIDWVPVDIAAIAIGELSIGHADDTFQSLRRRRKKRMRHSQFFHIVNPHHANWADLTPTILRYMPIETKTVSFVDWVELLKRSEQNNESFQEAGDNQNPALKLMDFFDNLQDRSIRFPKAKIALLETKNTQICSETLASLQSVNPDWMDLWMRQWDWYSMPKNR